MMTPFRKFFHVFPFLLAAYAILMGAIGTVSLLQNVNTPTPGTLVYYSAVDNCLVVKPITPPSWPALAEGLLRPGDCIEEIGSVPWWDGTRWKALLDQRVDAPVHQREVELYVRRGDDHLEVTVPVFRLTLQRLLETQLALVLVGFGFWALGMVVLLANRQSEPNIVFAIAAFIASMIAIAQQSMLNDDAGQLYTALTLSWAFSMLGAVRFHLGAIFPVPPTSSLLQRIRWILYPFAAVSIVMHQLVMIWIHHRQAWIPQVEIAASALDCGLLVIGSAFCIWRIFRYSGKTKILPVEQGQVLLWSWIIGDIPLLVATIWYQLTLSWNAPSIPILYIIFFPIINLTGTAYAMLRYQTFAYRGTTINTLTVVFISAALALFYTTFLVFFNLFDAFQFTLVWGATLLTTLVWYLNTPVRRRLRRFFQREAYHYELAYDFAERVSGDHLDLVVQQAVQFVYRKLDVEWAAIRLEHVRSSNWLVMGNNVLLPLPENPSLSLSEYWPTLPMREIPIQLLKDQVSSPTILGTLWIGPRTTSEPIDMHDERLLSLLTDYLARQIRQHIYIQQLTHVPIQIEDAQDRLRGEISMELHDDVLQYLASLSLKIEALLSDIRTSPEKVAQQLTQSVGEIRHRQHNMRRVMEKLGVIHQAEQRFQITTRTEMFQRCVRHGIQLEWEELGDGWEALQAPQAHALFKIIDLAVANACLHAHPTSISVLLRAEVSEFVVAIRDDGRGFVPDTQIMSSSRFGLTNMRNRAKQFGGSCDITSQPGQGTAVVVRIPRYQTVPTDAGQVVAYYRQLMDVSLDELAKQLKQPVNHVARYEIEGVDDPYVLRQLISMLAMRGVISDYETVRYVWKRGARQPFPEPSDLQQLITLQAQSRSPQPPVKITAPFTNRRLRFSRNGVIGLGIVGLIIFSLVMFRENNEPPQAITTGCTNRLDRLYEQANAPLTWWRDPQLSAGVIEQLGQQDLHYIPNGSSEPPHPGAVIVWNSSGLEAPIIINRIVGTWVEVVHPVDRGRQQWQCRSLSLAYDARHHYFLQDEQGTAIDGWVVADNVREALFPQDRIERVRGTAEDLSWSQDQDTIYVYLSSDLYRRLAEDDGSLAKTLGGPVLASDPSGILAFTTASYSQCIAHNVWELVTQDQRFMITSHVTSVDYTLKYTGDRIWVRPWYGQKDGGWIEINHISCSADGR